MNANDLFGHIRLVGKEKENALRDEHKSKMAQIDKDRLNRLESLRLSLKEEFKKERTLMIEKYIREEARKIKVEISVRKSALYNQMKRKARELALEMNENELAEIFAYRLRPIKDSISSEVKLIAPKKLHSLAEKVKKISGINCRVEIGDVGDKELILEDKRMIVELSIDEFVETEAERNSEKLYEILFD